MRHDTVVTGSGSLPSAFAVTGLAVESVAMAAEAVADLVAVTGPRPGVRVDRALASWWFGSSLRPDGWSLPPVWDTVAGDYRTADGWIRLHTNAPHHRTAALSVLGVRDRHGLDRAAVAPVVATWTADELETAVVAAGGVAAAMRTAEAWAVHPQGAAVAGEPLVHERPTAAGPRRHLRPSARPLAGWRVLDLTRVLAGPVATRFLAGFGADVLRVDPPSWDEPAIVPEVTLGKRCCRLDASTVEGRRTLEGLLRSADVLVHGYRPGALDALLGDIDRRSTLRPGLVEVCLDAYGWTGPWRERRGFDSLVQMSAGIADDGARWKGTDAPHPLPVQALDHATGYLVAAAVVDGVRRRVTTGEGTSARCSLARTAVWLRDVTAAGGHVSDDDGRGPIPPDGRVERPESTPWGPAYRLAPPVEVDGTPMVWDRPASPLGAHPAAW